MAQKRWPTNRELFSWFLFDRMEDWEDESFDPSKIAETLEEFERTPFMELHEELCNGYSEYSEQFFGPNAWEESAEEEDEEE